MLKERVKLLGSMVDHVDNSLLNQSIERRLVLLNNLVDSISQAIHTSTLLESLRDLPLEQQCLIFFDDYSIKRNKNYVIHSAIDSLASN